MASRSNSVSIVLPRRSAMLGIGLGLVLVAVMSVTITWLLFKPEQDDGATNEGSDQELAANLDPKPAEPPGEAKVVPAEAKADGQAVVSAGDEAPAPEDARGEQAPEGEPQAEKDSTGDEPPGDGAPPEGTQAPPSEGAADAPAPTTEDAAKEDGAKTKSAGESKAGTEEESKGTSDTKKARAPTQPKAPQPKAVVTIASSSNIKDAQVRLGSQTFPVDITREHKIPAGDRSIKWRKSAKEQWQSVGKWSFKVNRRYVVDITKQGPRVRLIQ